jgi:hypothetical protein
VEQKILVFRICQSWLKKTGILKAFCQREKLDSNIKMFLYQVADLGAGTIGL